MKRVKAACILQTLVFSQKPEMGYSRESALKINQDEFLHYKTRLNRTGIRYQIVDSAEQEDGSVLVHVKKQYNDKAEVAEYFE